MRPSSTCGFLVLATALAACGSNGSGPTNADAGDAAATDGGVSDGPSDGPARADGVGAVSMFSSNYTVFGQNAQFGTASAYFLPATGSATGSCTTQTTGPCTVQTCTTQASTDAGVKDGGPSPYASAGTITVTGVTTSGGTLTLPPNADGSYAGLSGAVAFWAGGESIHVQAPGTTGGAPAIDATLTAPSTLQITAPTFPQGHVAAQASAPLHVAWTGTSADNVIVQLTGVTSGQSVIARCSYPATDGAGDVPSAAITAVDVGTKSILISSTATTHLAPTGWSIDVSLASYAAQPGGLASGILDIR